MEAKLPQHWKSIQRCIFPEFEDEVGPTTPMHQRIMVAIDVLGFERHILETSLFAKGRPQLSRAAFANSFIAKAILNLHSTKQLIERLKIDRVLLMLCGFDPSKKLPCEASFSNAFSEMAESEILNEIHAAVVKDGLKDDVVFHISRDATDVPAREKVAKVAKKDKGKRKTKKLRGMDRRLAKQGSMTLEEMLKDLPSEVGSATKRGHSWKGYKLHLDVSDQGIPISAVLTSAQVHDSQVALPLEEMSSKRVASLYTLMDSAYDAEEIKEFIVKKDKISIIEPHVRATQTRELDPASRARYKERTTVERAFSWLKDAYGMRRIQVKGIRKVMVHIMAGILALTAIRLVSTA